LRKYWEKQKGRLLIISKKADERIQGNDVKEGWLVPKNEFLAFYYIIV
jgi:hypothetical protein